MSLGKLRDEGEKIDVVATSAGGATVRNDGNTVAGGRWVSVKMDVHGERIFRRILAGLSRRLFILSLNSRNTF